MYIEWCFNGNISPEAKENALPEFSDFKKTVDSKMYALKDTLNKDGKNVKVYFFIDNAVSKQKFKKAFYQAGSSSGETPYCQYLYQCKNIIYYLLKLNIDKGCRTKEISEQIDKALENFEKNLVDENLKNNIEHFKINPQLASSKKSGLSEFEEFKITIEKVIFEFKKIFENVIEQKFLFIDNTPVKGKFNNPVTRSNTPFDTISGYTPICTGIQDDLFFIIKLGIEKGNNIDIIIYQFAHELTHFACHCLYGEEKKPRATNKEEELCNAMAVSMVRCIQYDNDAKFISSFFAPNENECKEKLKFAEENLKKLNKQLEEAKSKCINEMTEDKERACRQCEENVKNAQENRTRVSAYLDGFSTAKCYDFNISKVVTDLRKLVDDYKTELS